MKRICVASLIVAILGSCGAMAGSAHAIAVVRCAEVWVKGSGRFADDKCTDPKAPKEYIKVHFGGFPLPESECAKVWVIGSGGFQDIECRLEGAPNEYIEVWYAKKFKEDKLSPEYALEIKGGFTVKCKKATVGSASKPTGDTTGLLDLAYSECKSGLGTCTGLGEASGTISVNSEYRVRYITKEPKAVAFALLLTSFHFSCGTTLVVARGCLASPVEPINTAAEVLTLKYKQKGPGEQEPSKVFNEAGTAEEPCTMEASISGGAFTTASEADPQEIATEESISIEA